MSCRFTLILSSPEYIKELVFHHVQLVEIRNSFPLVSSLLQVWMGQKDQNETAKHWIDMKITTSILLCRVMCIEYVCVSILQYDAVCVFMLKHVLGWLFRIYK